MSVYRIQITTPDPMREAIAKNKIDFKIDPETTVMIRGINLRRNLKKEKELLQKELREIVSID